MSRLLVDNARRGRGGDWPLREDDPPRGRSSIGAGDDALEARFRDRRNDPSGRRSLTGLEFRRRRSI